MSSYRLKDFLDADKGDIIGVCAEDNYDKFQTDFFKTLPKDSDWREGKMKNKFDTAWKRVGWPAKNEPSIMLSRQDWDKFIHKFSDHPRIKKGLEDLWNLDPEKRRA